MREVVEFSGLEAQRRRLRPRIEGAVATVIDHGSFILGPEVAALEAELARLCGVRHAVGCSSGTDALLLALLAWQVGPGDAVFVPAFTFASTAEVVALLGATPVFVDVEGATFNIDHESLLAAVESMAGTGLRPVGVIAVDLFGQPADYDAIAPIADRHGFWVLADAAQSLGGALGPRRVGSVGDAAATSFFPAKPLGCYGDGGAVFTDDDELAGRLRSLRAHGQGADRYDHVRIGINGRLDTMQAAVLLVKLEVFEEELVRRQRVADRYRAGLAGVVEVPEVRPGAVSSWAQYTVVAADRDGLASGLGQDGIPSAVYYRRPLHRQAAFCRFPTAPDGLPTSERLADHVVSLPMHAYLGEAAQERIIDSVKLAVRSGR